jgi:hypothetical protein
MTALGLASPSASQKIVAGRVQVAVFTATLFLSAALLFGIQPMFTKMVLPRLGGSPSVWSVAMVFFQTALLAGYLYAHLRRDISVSAGPFLFICAYSPPLS